MPALNSSNVSSAEYDDETRELAVTFRSGAAYTYLDVPRDVYEELLSSPSPGKFFYRAIRDSYSYRRG